MRPVSPSKGFGSVNIVSIGASVPQPRVHHPEVCERLRPDGLSPLDEWDSEDVPPAAHVPPGVTPDAANVFETPHQRRGDEVAEGQVAPRNYALVHPLQPQLRGVRKP